MPGCTPAAHPGTTTRVGFVRVGAPGHRASVPIVDGPRNRAGEALMRHRTSDRDGGLRRVSSLTRWLTAGAVALVGVLSAIVAQAVPGSSSGTATTPPPTGDVGTV